MISLRRCRGSFSHQSTHRIFTWLRGCYGCKPALPASSGAETVNVVEALGLGVAGSLWTARLDDRHSEPANPPDLTAGCYNRLEYVAPRGPEMIQERAESKTNTFSEDVPANWHAKTPPTLGAFRRAKNLVVPRVRISTSPPPSPYLSVFSARIVE
jgi:hypothetical protein